MDPYEAAEKALAANSSVFQERTIRVDRVRLPSAEGLQSAKTALTKRDAWLPSGTDPKRSLFVGGLDYAAKEEDVRVFFEALVKAERGEREGGGRWVTEVRLIRDRETQMGKGFGYVHFVVSLVDPSRSVIADWPGSRECRRDHSITINQVEVCQKASSRTNQ